MNQLTSWKTVCYLAAIFLGGGVTGAVITAGTVKKKAFPPPDPAHIARHMRSRLQDRLQLTPAQMEKIDPIIDRASAELAAAQTDSRQRVAEIFRKANAQIATELTPEQQRTFAEMEHERLEFLRRKGCSPPPPR